VHDSKILSSCIESRTAYDKIAKHVDVTEFTPLAAYWWPLIEDWYANDSKAEKVDSEVLRSIGKRKVNEKHQETMLGFYDALPDPVSPENIVNELLEIKRFVKGHELASVITEDTDRRHIKRILSEYNQLLNATQFENSEIQYAKDTNELDHVLAVENKLPLIPKILNDKCDGGALPGDHIVVFAPPEMGKTMFAVAQTGHWLRLGKRILYIGNEDNINKIKGRVRMNLSNMTKEDVRQWPEEANKRATERGIDDRLFMVHMHPGSPSEIEELVIEHEPDILVLDQIRNLGGRGDGLTAKLNQIAIDVRNLLGKYDLIGLSLTQAYAGEHGKPKIWYNSDDVADSRIGIPAQADLLIGLGGDYNMISRGNRAFSLCKNKLGGDHEGFIATFDKSRNKIL
jgi:KaiC/GvpD/RAD55 family RecA-like ATPase